MHGVTRFNKAFNEIATIGEISFTARINPNPWTSKTQECQNSRMYLQRNKYNYVWRKVSNLLFCLGSWKRRSSKALSELTTGLRNYHVHCLKMTWVTCALTSQLLSNQQQKDFAKLSTFMDRIYFCHQRHIVWLPLLVHVKVTDDHMDKIVKSIGLLQQCSLNMAAENQELMYLGYFSKINILGFFAQQLSSTELTAGITERNSVSCWHYQP